MCDCSLLTVYRIVELFEEMAINLVETNNDLSVEANSIALAVTKVSKNDILYT